MNSVWLTLTENGMGEGGRPRHPLAVYFSLNKEQSDFFPSYHFPVRTDDGHSMVALASGHGGKAATSQHQKNLRSVPEERFGEWLKGRKRARPGDRVQFTDAGDGGYYARHLPQEGPR